MNAEVLTETHLERRPLVPSVRLDHAAAINLDFATHRYICYAPTGWSPFQDQDLDRYDIRADLKILRDSWDGLITYGTMGALAAIPEEAAKLGFKRLILGIYDLTDEAEIEAAFSLIERYPDLIRALCIGNEGLSFKIYDTAKLVACMKRFRARFPHLWITTSEPIFSWGLDDLVANVDFALPIIHPWIHEIFKDEAEMAAMWTIQAAQRLQILIDKPVLIKETGFPGDGKLYPLSLQTKFWRVLTREIGALTRDVHLAYFEAFDNPLKTTFSARQHWDCHWGLFDENRAAKPVLDAIRPYLISKQAPPAQIEFATLADRRARSDVSIVITGKDRPHYMREAIESVWAQIDDVRDLILVNDNSENEDVDALCRAYANRPGVHYVKRTTPGSSGTARNAGFALVQTKYVGFLDDDDLFAPGKIRAQVAHFAEHPELGFIATGANVIDSSGALCGRSGSPEFFPAAGLASMLAFCRVIHSSVLMKSALLKRHGIYLERFQGEDWELWCRFLREGELLGFLPEPLTQYRRHDSNISTHAYLNKAVDNVFGRHLQIDSRTILGSLSYREESGELLRGVIQTIHGRYESALKDLVDLEIPAARVARFICYRELGRHAQARFELTAWTDKLGLTDELDLRLRVHEAKFRPRRPMVGSPALLFEHRLLAQDAYRATTFGHPNLDLRRYFHQNPKNISIERNGSGEAEDLFFKRVSLTSC